MSNWIKVKDGHMVNTRSYTQEQLRERFGIEIAAEKCKAAPVYLVPTLKMELNNKYNLSLQAKPEREEKIDLEEMISSAERLF